MDQRFRLSRRDLRQHTYLAENRAKALRDYVKSLYRFEHATFSVDFEPEDWEGLVDLLERDQPPYREGALRVITRYGIFNGRERHLMELQGGSPYKDMLRHFFPRLRRIEVIVRYEDDKTEDE